MLYLCFCFFPPKQAAMQAYENKGAEVYTNGSARHMNGAELTKMKEVAFEKNPSEPMVKYLHTHIHTHIHTQRTQVFLYLLWSCRFILTDCCRLILTDRGSL